MTNLEIVCLFVCLFVGGEEGGEGKKMLGCLVFNIWCMLVDWLSVYS